MKCFANDRRPSDAARSLLLSTAIITLACAGVLPARAQSVTITDDVDPIPLPLPTSNWNVGTDLIVGSTAAGSLAIEAGGTVNNVHAVIGNAVGVTGTATVLGNGSIWNNTGVLYVGGEGNGTLTIEGGGKVISTQNSSGIGNTTGAGFIGLGSDSTGTVAVSGADSGWHNDHGDLVIGQAGNGLLTIEDGGTVDNESGWIAAETDSIGTVKVSGEGSTWANRSALFIGEDGEATLTILDGGKVTSGDDGSNAYIGDNSDGVGTVTVSGISNGTASSWTHHGDLVIGEAGNGQLAIKDGGTVDNDYGYIGAADGGTGTVEVVGPGSLWDNSGRLYIGDEGNGTLTIKDGARVEVGGAVSIGRVSGQGTLIIEGTAASRGVLETSGITRGSGTASVTVDGGTLRATQNNSNFFSGFGAQVIAIGTNDVVVDTNNHDIGISTTLGGVGGLIKDGEGVLTLSGTNSYDGGTAIDQGVLQVGSDENLGNVVGDLSFDAGTLVTSADITTARGVSAFGTGGNVGGIAPDAGTTLTMTGVFDGGGELAMNGAGRLVLPQDSSGFAGGMTVNSGILSVDGILGGTMDVVGGRLQGHGQVGDTTNFAAGTIAPGNSIGELAVDGDYVGAGGTLEIEAVLGDDASATDRLIVTGNASGSTNVDVINIGGTGAPTTEGIKIVDAGSSDPGSFTLVSSYMFDGDPAVVAGAYAYRLYQGSVSAPGDGDWYLRSVLPTPGGGPTGPTDPVDPAEPTDPTDPSDPADPSHPADPVDPLYQPGAPIYEAYAAVLQSFNTLDTLQRRVGNRAWVGGVVDTGAAPAAAGPGTGIWSRIVASHLSVDPRSSTTGATYDSDSWQIQAGGDGLILSGDAGRLVGGLSMRYGTIAADIASLSGNGSIGSTGYGMGGTLTWYGAGGFYLDAQANLTWFDSELSSSTAGTGLVSGNDGFGYAAGIEVGQQIALGPNWSITPQAQLTYSAVDYDDFTDGFGATISLADGASLRGRLGLSADYQNAWTDTSGQTSRAHGYGIANLYYEFLPETAVDLADVRLTSIQDTLWGGLGLGGTYNWGNDRYAVHGEVTANTSLTNLGRSYDITGTAGFEVNF